MTWTDGPLERRPGYNPPDFPGPPEVYTGKLEDRYTWDCRVPFSKFVTLGEPETLWYGRWGGSIAAAAVDENHILIIARITDPSVLSTHISNTNRSWTRFRLTVIEREGMEIKGYVPGSYEHFEMGGGAGVMYGNYSLAKLNSNRDFMFTWGARGGTRGSVYSMRKMRVIRVNSDYSLTFGPIYDIPPSDPHTRTDHPCILDDNFGVYQIQPTTSSVGYLPFTVSGLNITWGTQSLFPFSNNSLHRPSPSMSPTGTSSFVTVSSNNGTVSDLFGYVSVIHFSASMSGVSVIHGERIETGLFWNNQQNVLGQPYAVSNRPVVDRPSRYKVDLYFRVGKKVPVTWYHYPYNPQFSSTGIDGDVSETSLAVLSVDFENGINYSPLEITGTQLGPASWHYTYIHWPYIYDWDTPWFEESDKEWWYWEADMYLEFGGTDTPESEMSSYPIYSRRRVNADPSYFWTSGGYKRISANPVWVSTISPPFWGDWNWYYWPYDMRISCFSLWDFRSWNISYEQEYPNPHSYIIDMWQGHTIVALDDEGTMFCLGAVDYRSSDGNKMFTSDPGDAIMPRPEQLEPWQDGGDTWNFTGDPLWAFIFKV